MDKIKVNNQVVSMRKFVKQAKTRAINKCTKQIKFLENRKGSDEKMAKSKRKHKRLLEEVIILKKIKPDSVSKLALSKAKDWKAVLAEKNVPLEERCFAMLAYYAPVQEAVEKFHQDNNELIPKIPELLKQWEDKKSRASKIQKKKQINSNNPNTLPIQNKTNALKSNGTQIKLPNTENLEHVPNSSDLKSTENGINENNVSIEQETEQNEPSENLSSRSTLNDSAENESQLLEESESDASDDFFLDCSDSVNQQDSEMKQVLPVETKAESDRSHRIPKQSKKRILENQAYLPEKKALKKETLDNVSNNKTNAQTNNETVKKSSDIRSKLLEISMSKTKVQNKLRYNASDERVHSNAEKDSDSESSVNAHDDNNAKTRCIKSEDYNKIKAVTVLDLNDLQDMDEIPIEKSDTDTEDESGEDTGKQMKDPFFLRDGEPVSESDEDKDTEKEFARKRDPPPFKKKPYGSFRERNNDSFQRRRFEKHSGNGENLHFRDNRFMKNRKELSFKDNKRDFKRTFDDSSKFGGNKNFKFASKHKFSDNKGENSFTKNSKEKSFSKNHNRDVKRNGYPPKTNQSSSLQINKADEKPLHPSWEAKRKLKEAANTKFQGKRMVFKE